MASGEILDSTFKFAGMTFVLKWVLLILFIVVVAIQLGNCETFKAYPTKTTSYYW